MDGCGEEIGKHEEDLRLHSGADQAKQGLSKGTGIDRVYTGLPPGASVFDSDQVDLATGMWLPADNQVLNIMEVAQGVAAQAADAAAEARSART